MESFCKIPNDVEYVELLQMGCPFRGGSSSMNPDAVLAAGLEMGWLGAEDLHS